MNSLMVDIETLATGADAAILTIAAQRFDPFATSYPTSTADHLYMKVTLESQDTRRVDEKTIEWWMTQPAEIWQDAFSEDDRISLSDAMEQLRKMAWHSKLIWMQGPTFDAVILEHAFRQLDMPLPWSFWQIRDSRTLLSMAPHIKRATVDHNALSDCRGQIAAVQQALRHFGVEELA